MHRVVVTGMGALSPFGLAVSSMRNGLLSSSTALKFDDGYQFVVGAIKEDFEEKWSAGDRRMMSRSTMAALVAAEEAVMQAKAVDLNHDETLVNVGTCMSDLMEIGDVAEKVKNNQKRRVSPYFVPRILNNLPAGHIAMKYQMKGGVEATSTACATGLHCIGNSFRAIRDGYARRALAGAVECALNPVGLAGFDRMRALAKGNDPTISRPFDDSRAGFVLSEGAGLLMLERLDDALARGAIPLAEIVGYGVSSDAYHISTPDPMAVGAVLSMKRAIEDGKIDRKQIEYVNAHATSTPTGDAVEAEACRQVFEGQDIVVSSVKGHIGHLLGAAGSVEVIATICAIMDGVIPENLNLTRTKEGNGLRIIEKPLEWSSKERITICNSFGFGSTNASLILKRI